MVCLSGPMMMPAEGIGAHPDVKQMVELSKEGVCPATEPPKPKVRPLALLTNHRGCLLCRSRQLAACSNRCMCAEFNARMHPNSTDTGVSVAAVSISEALWMQINNPCSVFWTSSRFLKFQSSFWTSWRQHDQIPEHLYTSGSPLN